MITREQIEAAIESGLRTYEDLGECFNLDPQDMKLLMRQYELYLDKYIVYLYAFPTNKVYIGRTSVDTGRYGTERCYQGQYVGKKMLEYPEFMKTVIYSSNNIFSAYFYEHLAIKDYYDQSYNAAKEENWFATALRDLAKDKDITPEDVQKQLDEFVQIVKILPAKMQKEMKLIN